jgi:hypothetical protein
MAIPPTDPDPTVFLHPIATLPPYPWPQLQDIDAQAKDKQLV